MERARAALSTGTCDKYMGDCIMAFWNAPLGDPEHTRHPYRAGRWQAAGTLPAECRALAEARLDALYGLYDERLAAYARTPPPADWDGVHVATTK